MSHSLWLGDVFGGRALELAGRVVHPRYQRQGVASYMLEELVASERPGYLATYTRNPAIIKMMQRQSDEIYPLHDDASLRMMALNMDDASELDVVYHIDRYGEQGLFVGEDPACRPAEDGDRALKQRFDGLMSVRNALIIVARTKRGIV